MGKNPAFQFYPGDWLKDASLKKCSPLTRGVWFEFLLAMFDDHRNYFIEGDSFQLARIGRCNYDDVVTIINELCHTKTADVTECHGIYKIVCRRYKREKSEREMTTFRQRKCRHKKRVTALSHENHDASSSSSSFTYNTNIAAASNNDMKNSPPLPVNNSPKTIKPCTWLENDFSPHFTDIAEQILKIREAKGKLIPSPGGFKKTLVDSYLNSATEYEYAISEIIDFEYKIKLDSIKQTRQIEIQNSEFEKINQLKLNEIERSKKREFEENAMRIFNTLSSDDQWRITKLAASNIGIENCNFKEIKPGDFRMVHEIAKIIQLETSLNSHE